MEWDPASSLFDSLFGGPIGPYVLTGFELAFRFAPIWLPLFLIIAAWQMWVIYVRSAFIASQDHVLLEIKIPETVDKSPAAMEAILVGMYMTSGESTFIDRLWLGKVRVWHSLELVSLGGQIHFYVWTRKTVKQLVMNQWYAQYPGIEVTEVPDYAERFNFNLQDHNLYGADWKLKKSSVYPVKTYVDYGLDRDPKEEYKIDPLAHVLEWLGSIGPREQIWIQIVIRAHHKGPYPDGGLVRKTFDDIAKEEVKKIFSKPEMIDLAADPQRRVNKLSKQQIEVISAIEMKRSKFLFDTGLRVVYLADREAFDSTNIGTLMSFERLFGHPGYNVWVPTRFNAKYDYPWQDYKGYYEDQDRIKLYNAYRRRGWFHPPNKYSYAILSTEEVATMYHLPGATVQTPSMPRIPSTRREAPANLPV